MKVSDKYRFCRVTRDDLPLLAEWLTNPHVREWWDSDQAYDAADLADARAARWIVYCDGRPIAFMQDYSVHGWADHHFSHLPQGVRGIDQYIGDPSMIGAGHGSAFISKRMQALFEEGVPVIATDPHPDNARAIAVYEKLGFVPSGPPQDTQWGMILPMLATRSAFKGEN